MLSMFEFHTTTHSATWYGEFFWFHVLIFEWETNELKSRCYSTSHWFKVAI